MSDVVDGKCMSFLQNNMRNVVKTRYYEVLVAISLVLSASGCGRTLSSEDLVAKVGDAELYVGDVAVNLVPGTSPEDSSAIAEAYVNAWVRKQLKIQEAEKVLPQVGVDIETMVADYRNSLLTRRLDQYYVERKVDTVVTDSLVSDYYERHKQDFMLDRDIVRGRILKVPDKFRQQAKLKDMMSATSDERKQDFNDMVMKNGLTLTEFDNWVSFGSFLEYLPTVRGKSYAYLLPERKIAELDGDGFKYYIQITDCVRKGEQAPLEWVADVIRKIIYNQRSGAALQTLEDSLYNAAVENRILKLYLPNNND